MLEDIAVKYFYFLGYDMAILNSLPQFLDALFCGLILGWRGFYHEP
jgi:hypothetical protein